MHSSEKYPSPSVKWCVPGETRHSKALTSIRHRKAGFGDRKVTPAKVCECRLGNSLCEPLLGALLCVCPFVVFLHLAVTSLGLGCYGCHRFSDRRRCRAQQLFHRRAGNTTIVCSTSRCLPTYTDNCPGKIDAENILFTYLNEMLWKGRRKFNYKDNYQILAVYSR